MAWENWGAEADRHPLGMSSREQRPVQPRRRHTDVSWRHSCHDGSPWRWDGELPVTQCGDRAVRVALAREQRKTARDETAPSRNRHYSALQGRFAHWPGGSKRS